MPCWCVQVPFWMPMCTPFAANYILSLALGFVWKGIDRDDEPQRTHVVKVRMQLLHTLTAK